jgi:hypothetical protein
LNLVVNSDFSMGTGTGHFEVGAPKVVPLKTPWSFFKANIAMENGHL